MQSFSRRVLNWFWAPVRENENWAQTLLRMLGNLVRGSITLVLVATAGIVAIVYASEVEHRRRQLETQSVTIEIRSEKAQSTKLYEVMLDNGTKLTIEAETSDDARAEGEAWASANIATYEDRDGKAAVQIVSELPKPRGELANECLFEFPVAIEVFNNSNLTLLSMDIDLTARRPGTSTNLLDYDERRISWDSIVPPQHSLVMCYKIGADPYDSSLVYSATAVDYSINLTPTEDWMLRETKAQRLSAEWKPNQ